MSAPVKLYFVAYEDSDGENHDYFVRATSFEFAFSYWYKEMQRTQADGDYYELENLVSIYEVPSVEGPIGVLDWPTERHLIEVGQVH